MGQLEEAAKSYEQVVALAPRHLEARLALSSLYQQLNQPDEALQALTQLGATVHLSDIQCPHYYPVCR